jgi:dephospho-CoA kinase
LTGNIASGKSTVAAFLADLGCFVIDADKLGHAALGPDQPSHSRVLEEFGPEVMASDGGIDRQRLGRVVFADASARRRLEMILHPDIRRREAELVDRWAQTVDRGIAVTEAALLFETGGAARYDRMIVVVAPDDERMRRLTALGMPREDALRRMSSQMDQKEKSRRADFVIDNGGDPESTSRQVVQLHQALMRDLASLEKGEPPSTNPAS